MPRLPTRSLLLPMFFAAALAGCDFLFPKDPNGGANIGMPCADSSYGGQSDCDPTQVCIAVTKQNMCTVLNCASDEECGKHDGIQNRCVPVANGTLGCVRGCSVDTADGGTATDAGTETDGGTVTDGGTTDAGSPSDCGRDDFVCYQAKSADHPICVPDCTTQDKSFCGYGTICDTETRQCAQKVCNGGGCPDGYVCASVDSAPLCVPDCRKTPTVCGAGFTCNSTGGCDVTLRKLYDTCGPSIGSCTGNTTCVELSDSWTAGCFLICNADSDCSSLGDRSTCALKLQNGLKACLTECYPQLTTCPTATSCVQVPEMSSTYCVPGVQ